MLLGGWVVRARITRITSLLNRESGLIGHPPKGTEKGRLLNMKKNISQDKFLVGYCPRLVTDRVYQYYKYVVPAY